MEAVSDAYRNGFHESLHPDLSDERLALLEQEKKFLWLHGFIDHDFDIEAWVDRRPLEAGIETAGTISSALEGRSAAHPANPGRPKAI